MPEPVPLSAVYAKLRSAVAASGGQSAFAGELGLSVSYVSDVMNARRDPGVAILRAIGLRKIVVYVPVKGRAGDD
jgi:transcriptional regulator with XRE-family HTH domain